MVSNSGSGQMSRNNAFTLTGNTQGTQIASMTGAMCQTDWLMIPCAINVGKSPSMSTTCVDRLCGGTFNADNQNLNSSSVISKYSHYLHHNPFQQKVFFFILYMFNNQIKIFLRFISGTVKPFRLIFHTDATEAPNDVGNRGFCLNYIQQPCTTKLR